MAYTYLIGWSDKNQWYYGVRYAKNANPNELWESYYTSSKHVKAMRKEHGEPDIIQVRRVFNCPLKAREYEAKVLKKLNVHHDDKWLNKGWHLGTISVGHHDEQTRQKISKSLRGKPKNFSPEHRRF